LFVAALLTVLFAVSVHLFARHGGPFVDSLSYRVGEVVAARAKSLADSGQPQLAAKVFQDALRAQFDDPRQRVWCYRRYGETLMQLDRWADAAETFNSALALNQKDWPSHRLLCEALKNLGRTQSLRDAARRWQNAATPINQQEVKAAQQYLK
jgi:Flp pilus assembly protein TadD